MIHLLPLFLACPAANDAKPDDTGTPGGSETGDPDTGSPPGLDCGELSAPWPLASAEDAWAAAGLAGPPIVYLTSLDSDVRNWSELAGEAFGCPTVTEDEASGTIVISGECENALGTLSGTVTYVTSPDGQYTATYEDFAFEDTDTGVRLAANGTWSVDKSSAFFDLAADYNYGGGSDTWGVVAWSLEAEFADELHMEGRVDVTDSPEGAGSFCIVLDEFAYSGSCTEESPSTLGIQGSAYAELVFDPDAEPACDGCAEVTIDGEDAGLYCR